MSTLQFEVLKKDNKSGARRGRLQLQHDKEQKPLSIETPVFMPVGTLSSVKSLDSADLQNLGASIILNNAYHLMLRPGAEAIGKLGGLRRFMAFDGAILTDSGGFQVFSLAKSRKITEDGVIFRSHIDGHLIHLTPEKLVAVQEALDPSIAMMLDVCPQGQASRQEVEEAMRLTSLWAQRNIQARQMSGPNWFGIVQGGIYEDLRLQHAQSICSMDFDGFAIGGVSVGESRGDIHRIMDFTAPLLPEAKPRYLMGVGTPEDLVHGVAAGVDMFDCVLPTRNARNGQLLTWRGKVQIKNSQYKNLQQPIDANCHCLTCQRYTVAYLRHLFIASELSYYRLASLHNLHFYMDLMSRMRKDLDRGCFDKNSYLVCLSAKN